MLFYVLQYLTIACAFLLPWGILGTVQSHKSKEYRKRNLFALLLLFCIVIITVTVVIVFMIN